MVNPIPTPLPASADAWQRFVRTLVIGLVVDVATAIAGALAAALPGVHWTKEWWIALGGLVATTAVKAIASYIARKVAPPA
jgi:hypothetical protein